MTKSDLKRLVKLLGPEGAKAGLLASNIEDKILKSMARKLPGSAAHGKMREGLVQVLVDDVEMHSLKPLEELLKMDYPALEEHFSKVSPSSEELMKIMKELDYKVSAEDKKHLRRFAARQISETALFSQVAGTSR